MPSHSLLPYEFNLRQVGKADIVNRGCEPESCAQRKPVLVDGSLVEEKVGREENARHRTHNNQKPPPVRAFPTNGKSGEEGGDAAQEYNSGEPKSKGVNGRIATLRFNGTPIDDAQHSDKRSRPTNELRMTGHYSDSRRGQFITLSPEAICGQFATHSPAVASDGRNVGSLTP